MKKNIYILLSIALLCCSCEGWFNVTSDSEIREEDHYKTDTGFQQTLTGCYIGMTDNSLYGKNLSWYATELLANQFQPVKFPNLATISYEFASYLFKEPQAVEEIEGTWAKAYNVIVNANEGLTNLEKDSTNINEINYHLIKGELLAIRAYVHFDLLRLYGYGNWANRSAELNNKLTIPYVTGISKDIAPQLSGAETIKKILSDLNLAASELKDYDPITGKHPTSYYAEVNEDGYWKNRTLHLNYYAVKALLARIYLWEGSDDSKTKALSDAEEVIGALAKGIRMDDMTTYCYLLDAQSVDNTTTSMASENLFGLDITDLTSKTTNYIKPGYLDTDYAAMFLGPDDALSLYENSSSDVRFSKLLSQSTNSYTKGYVPLKVYQGQLLNWFFKNKISMIRLPEIYYIAAECYATGSTPNLDKAMEMLNTIRQRRGIYNDLTGLSADEITEEIKKEYRKEFISEGVMFYYYKRTGTTIIPNYSEPMSDAQYVLPYPEFELQSGRVQ